MLSHGEAWEKKQDNISEKYIEKKILNNTYLADLSMWIAKTQKFHI